jgi:aryl-phospho-beta-D-glucosidase BglC (GH1 family)
MPNWCYNSVEIYHDDPAMIERARAGFNKGELLNEFIPVPQDLKDTIAGSFGDEEKQALLEAKHKANFEKYGYSNWYDFCVGEWGTKWDVGNSNEPAADIDGGLMLTFESAWAPPCDAYAKLTELGFSIRAMYWEPGMAFCGIWDRGDDFYFEYGGLSAQQVRDAIDFELDEAFGISDCVEEYENEEELGAE